MHGTLSTRLNEINCEVFNGEFPFSIPHTPLTFFKELTVTDVYVLVSLAAYSPLPCIVNSNHFYFGQIILLPLCPVLMEPSMETQYLSLPY